MDETMDSYSRDPKFESPDSGMTYLRCHGPVDETMNSYSRDPRFESLDMTYLWSCPCMVEWIRLRTRDVPCSNPLVVAVVPLGKALYPHCLVPRSGLKAVGPLVAKL